MIGAIGIIGAMPSELADIRAALGEAKVHNIDGFEFHMNEYKGKLVITACCGIGKVNAALCTKTMIDNYALIGIINTGIAGGMNREVKVCDIVISTEVVPHDLALTAKTIPNCPYFKCSFEADEDFINTAEKVCSNKAIKSFKGKIVSGDVFVTDSTIKNKLVSEYQPYAVDMESAAIGNACFLCDKPFVSVRCISDNADDEGAMSYDEFEKTAAKRVADVILAMVEELS